MTKAQVLPIDIAHMDGVDKGEFHTHLSTIWPQEDLTGVMFIVDNEVVACGGIRVFPWSVCESFFSAKPDTPPYIFVQARQEWYRMTEPFTRAVMHVDILNANHIRFAYSLGARPEGIMRKAGPLGEDYITFVRLKAWQ